MLALINSGLAFLRENILLVVVAAAVVAHLVRQNKHYVQSLMDRVALWFSASSSSATTLRYSEPSEAANPNAPPERSARSSDMLRVRELQQQKANEMAILAAEAKKKKAEEERRRKNEIAQRKETGRRLGSKADEGNSSSKSTFTSTTTSSRSNGSGGGGYNPMQPWTANSGGYRPQRRTVNRG